MIFIRKIHMFDTNLQVFSLVAPYVWRKGSHLFLFLKNTLNFSRYIKLCIQHIFHTFVKFEYAVFVVYNSIVNTYFSEIWGKHDVRAVWVDTFLINKFSTIKLSSPTCDKKDDLLSWLYSSSLLHALDLLWKSDWLRTFNQYTIVCDFDIKMKYLQQILHLSSWV